MDSTTNILLIVFDKFHRILDSLQGDVEKIRRRIDSNSSDHHTHNEQGKSSQVVFGELRRPQAEIDAERAHEAQKEARDSRNEGRDKMRLRFEVAGLIVGVVLALANVGLWIVTIESAHATRDAAEAANRSATASELQVQATKQSIEASITQFHLDQRAWISLIDTKCDDCYAGHSGRDAEQIVIRASHAYGKLINTGKTPADDAKIDFVVHYAGTFYYSPSPAHRPTLRVDDHPERRVIKIIGVVPPGQQRSVTFTLPGYGTQFPAKSSAEGAVIYIDGVITYSTTWGEIRETKFCYSPIDMSTSQNADYYDTCKPGSNTMK